MAQISDTFKARKSKCYYIHYKGLALWLQKSVAIIPYDFIRDKVIHIIKAKCSNACPVHIYSFMNKSKEASVGNGNTMSLNQLNYYSRCDTEIYSDWPTKKCNSNKTYIVLFQIWGIPVVWHICFYVNV